MKPTEAQIKEFWEGYGFDIGEYADEWVSPDYTSFDGLPPIDLNNLFKYAVPKVIKVNDYFMLRFNRSNNEWDCQVGLKLVLFAFSCYYWFGVLYCQLKKLLVRSKICPSLDYIRLGVG